MNLSRRVFVVAGGYSRLTVTAGSKWDRHRGPPSKSLRVGKSVWSLAGGSVIPVFGNERELMPVGLCPKRNCDFILFYFFQSLLPYFPALFHPNPSWHHGKYHDCIPFPCLAPFRASPLVELAAAPRLIVNLLWLPSAAGKSAGGKPWSHVCRGALTPLRAQEGPQGVPQQGDGVAVLAGRESKALGSLHLSSLLPPGAFASLHCIGGNGKVINQSRVFLFSLGEK